MESHDSTETGSWRIPDATIFAAGLLHASSIYMMAAVVAG
jgi:hypothetical protein